MSPFPSSHSGRRRRVEATAMSALFSPPFLAIFLLLSPASISSLADAFRLTPPSSRIRCRKGCNVEKIRIPLAVHTNTDVERHTTESGGGDNKLSPVIREIVDERREFELNLGRAMYVLRNDYPALLVSSPDFSIYHEDIRVVDPSGVQLTGLPSYRNSFHFFRSVSGVFYDVSSSDVRHRMVYDFARSELRVSWNVTLRPKLSEDPLHVDGVSVYTLDRKSGKIVEHRVERVLMNNIPLRPPYGVFSALNPEVQQMPQGVLQPTPSI